MKQKFVKKKKITFSPQRQFFRKLNDVATWYLFTVLTDDNDRLDYFRDHFSKNKIFVEFLFCLLLGLVKMQWKSWWKWSWYSKASILYGEENIHKTIHGLFNLLSDQWDIGLLYACGYKQCLHPQYHILNRGFTFQAV